MLRTTTTLAQHLADNPAVVVAGSMAAVSACAMVNVYYGYWFSHWRA